MTVVHPNAVSGINSITVQSGNSLSIHKADGSLIRTITGSTGVTTFATVSVGSAYTDFAQGGGLNIGLGASISNGSGNVLTFGTGGDDRATIDASGYLVHGGGSSRSAVGGAQLVQVEGLTAAAGFSAVRNSNDANGPYISLAKSRGTALGAVTVIQDDDDLGAIRFGGGDGTDIASEGARIEATVDGTPGSNDIPTRLTFQTTADGAAAPTERLRITSDGNVGINSTVPSAARLVVQTTSGTSFAALKDNTGAAIGFGGATQPRILLEAGASASDLLFYTAGGSSWGSPSWSERLRLTSAGYLGINHTPYTRLDVKHDNGVAYDGNAQSIAYNAARFLNTSGHTSGGTYTGFQFNISGDSQNRICSMGMITEASNSKLSSLVLHTDDGGNRTEKLRITGAGNVGVGTVTPDTLLHLAKGSGGAQLKMQRTDAASNDNDYGRIYWESHSGTLTGQISVASQSAENDGYMLFKTAASGSLAERLRITNANAWGIAGANYGTSGQVLTSGGSGAAVSWATATGGIDEADIWRLTTSFQGNASGGYIGSNWERGDTDGQNHKGTGMSESSGTFSFPSTGFWFVQFTSNFTTQYTPAQPHSHRNTATIKTTIDNSSYGNAAASSSGIYNYGSNSYPSHGTATCSIIFDVTSTTNCKCRFDWGAGQGSETCKGDTAVNNTFVTFIRLADT